jgi:hypothetical protein
MQFSTYSEVPEWARFLTLDEFRAFLRTIEDELRSRGLLFQDRDGALEVIFPDGQLAVCGLANVALRCGAAGRDGYAREVALHFDRILGKPTPPPPFTASFAEVRSVIRVRIYSDEYLRETDAKLISRPLAAGLTSVVVYDMPGFIASVSPEHLEAWKMSADDVFRVGIANVGREEVARDAFQLGEAELFSLAASGGFAASQVFHVGSYLAPSKLGAIIAMPSRHLLICYPIKPATVLDALRRLVPFVDDIYNNPPGDDERSKLTTNLYWWRKGRLVCIPAGMDVLGLTGSVVVPPEEFIKTVLSKAAPPSK